MMVQGLGSFSLEVVEAAASLYNKKGFFIYVPAPGNSLLKPEVRGYFCHTAPFLTSWLAKAGGALTETLGRTVGLSCGGRGLPSMLLFGRLATNAMIIVDECGNARPASGYSMGSSRPGGSNPHRHRSSGGFSRRGDLAPQLPDKCSRLHSPPTSLEWKRQLHRPGASRVISLGCGKGNM